MQPLLTIKPPRPNYLLYLLVLGLTLATLIALSSIFLYQDEFPRAIIPGVVLGWLLNWVYDEIRSFERWSITLTENAITMKQGWFKQRIYLLTGFDRQRTIAYNSENNLRNRIQYTFWLLNGESVLIGKALYGKAQVNTLLEKIGLPKT